MKIGCFTSNLGYFIGLVQLLATKLC